MNDPGTSDRPVVPAKQPNKAGKPGAEVVEGRGLAKGNTDKRDASRTQSRNHDAPNALERVREVARKDGKAKFTALLHHVTIDRLREAFLALRRNASAGVDGVTWEQYAGGGLEEKLQDLHARVQRGA